MGRQLFTFDDDLYGQWQVAEEEPCRDVWAFQAGPPDFLQAAHGSAVPSVLGDVLLNVGAYRIELPGHDDLPWRAAAGIIYIAARHVDAGGVIELAPRKPRVQEKVSYLAQAVDTLRHDVLNGRVRVTPRLQASGLETKEYDIRATRGQIT